MTLCAFCSSKEPTTDQIQQLGAEHGYLLPLQAVPPILSLLQRLRLSNVGKNLIVVGVG